MTESTTIITFPSRMQVEMKGRSVSQMRATMKSAGRSIADALTEALRDSTVRLVDTGDNPPDHVQGSNGGVDWLGACIEDRIYGLKSLRILSYPEGHKAAVQIACQRCPERFGWNVDLRDYPEGDLLITHLDDEAAEKYRAGEPFEIDVAGKHIKYRMLNGKDEKSIEKLGRRDPDMDTIEVQTAMQIIEIDGVHPNDKRAWLRKLGEEAIDLQVAMAEAAFICDTTVEVYCPHCQTRFEIMVPFGQADFWIPLEKARTARQRLREKLLVSKGS